MAIIKTELDLTSNFCQCCMSRGTFKKMNSIGPYELTYQNMLLFCFSIFIENMAEKDCLICDSCIGRLSESHRFRRQVEESQIQLKEALNKSIEFKYSEEDQFTDVGLQSESDEIDIHEVKIDLNETENGEDSTSESIIASKQEETIDNANCKNFQRMLRSRAREKLKLELEAIEKSSSKRTKIKKITIDKSRTCDVCGELFPTYLSKRRHINIHYPNFICDQCGRPFITEHSMISHASSHRKETSTCTTCGKDIKMYNLKQHMAKHKLADPRFKCSHCDLIFRKFHERIQHMKKMHDVDVFTYTCKTCPKKYTTSSQLYRHVRRSHLLQLSYYCDSCGKGFFDKQNLQDHIALHTGEKNEKCDICSRTFIKRWNMQQHRKRHFEKKSLKST